MILIVIIDKKKMLKLYFYPSAPQSQSPPIPTLQKLAHHRAKIRGEEEEKENMKTHYTHFLLLLSQFPLLALSYHDYADALSKSILFFEGQRSGYLPADQRMTWRGNSGLGDGWTAGADLTGGYYDAGDNVKFNFPMAFTTTMLAWSVVEFGDCMPPAELRNALVAIRWSADYLLKTVSQPNRIFVQV